MNGIICRPCVTSAISASQKWSHEKLYLISHENCEEFNFIDFWRQRLQRNDQECAFKVGNINFFWITADHKVLSNTSEARNKHRYAIVGPPNRSRHIRANTKLLRKHQGACKSSWSQLGGLKSFILTILWNSEKLVKIFPGIIVRLHHHTDRRLMVLQKKQCADWKKTPLLYCLLLQSGLNESWWADSMECYTYLRNVTDLLSDGKTPYERRFGQPFKWPVIPFGSLVEYHPITAEDQSESINLERKSFLYCSSDTRCTRV